MLRPEVLRLERVSCKRDGMLTLDNLEMTVLQGEIVGFEPVNSYGLSSLLRVILFNQPLYYGYVYYLEKKVNSWQDMRRTPNNIAVIGPRSSLVEGQTVMTNVFVLRRGFHQEILRPSLLRAQLEPFLSETGMHLDPDRYADSLTPFERVQAELLRAVVSGSHLVILREIGSVISEKELKEFHSILRHYAKKGMSFLYISPHFEELAQISERVLIFSEGTVVASLLPDRVNSRSQGEQVALTYSEEYHRKMVHHLRERTHEAGTDTLFEMRDICSGELQHLSLRVRRGEHLALQCLDSQIYLDLVRLVKGETHRWRGSIILNGEPVSMTDDRRIAVITDRPDRTMLFDSMSYMDNLCFTSDRKVRGFWLKRGIRKSIRSECEPILGAAAFSKRVRDLTDMEKYELVYTRILLQKPELVLIIQPFKGADARLRQRIWELQEALIDRGATLVLLAVNMADCLAIANRVIRIDGDMTIREYREDSFGELPLTIPLISLYEEESYE